MTCPCFRSDGESLFLCHYEPFFSDVIRFANQSAQFVSAYGEGLSGAQAGWANKQYHGHCTLPPDMIAEVKKSIPIS